MIAIPSSASVVSTKPWLFSSSFNARLERPISQRPSDTAVIPEPEPVGLYVKVASGFAFVNASPRAPITFSIEVEPSVATLPDTGVCASALDSAAAADVSLASVDAASVFFASVFASVVVVAAVDAAVVSFLSVVLEEPHAVKVEAASAAAIATVIIFLIIRTSFLIPYSFLFCFLLTPLILLFLCKIRKQ